MRKMSEATILFIGPVPPEVGGQSYGGVATHLWELANRTHKSGYGVYVFTDGTTCFTKDGVNLIGLVRENKLLRALGILKLCLTLDGSRIHFLRTCCFSLKEKLEFLHRAYCLKRILDSVKPDLIHVHSLDNWDNIPLKILHPSIPIVLTDHGAWDDIDTEKKLILVRVALDIARYVICVSHHIKEKLERKGLSYPKKTFVIYNPIDVHEFPMFDRTEIRGQKWGNKKIIFFSGVSRPIERKRLDLLLKAYSQSNLLRETCKLIILTTGEGTRYAKEFVLNEKVDALILDPLPRAEVLRYLSIADVCVVPSMGEAFGLTLIESLLVGTPVVGSSDNIGEIEDLLSVYIGESFDSTKEGEKELAQKIVKVLNAHFDREFLRKKIGENLSWEAKFREFDRIYKEALHSN